MQSVLAVLRTLPEEPDLRLSGGLALAVAALATVAGTGLGLAGTRLLGLLGVPSMGRPGAFAFFAAGIGLQSLVGAGGVAYLYARVVGLPVRAGRPGRAESALAAVLVAGVVGAVWVAQAVTAALPGPSLAAVDGVVIPPTPVDLAFFALLSLAAVGPGHALLYRAAVQATLRRTTGPWLAVPAAVAVELAVAVALAGGSLPALPYAAALAVASLGAGYAYERTGTLVVPAVGYGTFRLALYVLSYLGPAGV